MAEPMHPFAVMADPVRRRIVEILASGEHTSGNIAEAIGVEFRISRTAVSKHLRILRDAGFVDVVADERWRWYYFTAEGFQHLDDCLDELFTKMLGGVGRDPFGSGWRDPLHQPPFGSVVRRKGPSRDPRPGMRGRQTSTPLAAEPETGLYPVRTVYAWPVDPVTDEDEDLRPPRIGG
ncbi:ArsR/SmtB family transcription factor [Microbacterium sp. bgisy203]|uniref:ArsR/SmtB family transcription factor n=1 Tax=Microbacterium sp. bgisy203 TaxID=3413799 RepID=UPI003D737083